ncbi:MAG TPA: helicase C-terminal domain-containing protein [Thermodesulfovibrionales bacterium]|nr:helicase C-terminal domain-containing protein [Thermodesulfovibrionales bacterium]
MDELTHAFNYLKKELPGYERRTEQFEMAREVSACLKENRRLLIEAGTGVGKSFAYLIPAILSKGKTVVSTGSIALQDQLVNKDLALLQNVLPQEFSFGLLKGKNNYLCLKRERELGQLGEPHERFLEWAATTDTGDKDELDFIPDFWPKVCGDSDDCNSLQCPHYGDCFYYEHFRDIRKKDILVVNHHLLIYDLLSGFNLLPFHDKLIIDEAHQLENVISHVSGSTLSNSRLMWLLYRLKGLKIAVDQLFIPVEAFFNAPVNLTAIREEVKGGNTFSAIPETVTEGLESLKKQLALDKVVHRLKVFKEAADDELRDRIDTTINSIGSITAVIDDFIGQADSNKVYYLLRSKNALELKSNLVECQESFGFLVSGYESIVMTSATLTAGSDFGFLKGRLGIMGRGAETGFDERVIGSPFDYRKQALLYLERDLPAPHSRNNETLYREGMKKIEGLINASRGRALVLFTSYRHLRYVSENISTEYPFKTQGDMPPAKIIRWFKKTPNPVLLATTTFWQGIDIKGDKLSLVIIAKIPFGSPGDPVYDERCRRLGERWFKDLALPSAILLLRQGFGRLIRGVDDYGVVAILDTRLVASSYARNIVSSLPAMDVVHEIDDVRQFLDSVAGSSAPEEGPIVTRSRSRNRRPRDMKVQNA